MAFPLCRSRAGGETSSWSHVAVARMAVRGGALLTAAGIFVWVATVAGWISVDIGVQLQSLALAGMVLLTSILALYLLALRGGRWRRIIKWGVQSGCVADGSLGVAVVCGSRCLDES